MKTLLISILVSLSFSVVAVENAQVIWSKDIRGSIKSWVFKNESGQLVTVNANTHREFDIKGDVWAIQTNAQFQQIRFCRMSGGSCLSSGIGILWDWDDYTSKGYTAQEFYREFLNEAERKISEYYGDDITPPDPSDFVSYLTYLINHGTKYNEDSSTFSITK